MAGTINLALSQQFDMNGSPLSGGLLYFFVAATTTPQTAFQNTALTIPHPNPIVLDASGRVPMFYLADGSIKIRLTDKNGVTIIAADQLLVIGPSAGGGGSGGGVDPTTVWQTGDLKPRFGTGPHTGFVRCNGGGIGKAGAAGATEYAAADARSLFEYLWNLKKPDNSPLLPVSPARGAGASTDFDAGCVILLPDLLGRALVGLDDKGGSRRSANRSVPRGLLEPPMRHARRAGGDRSISLQNVGQLPDYTPEARRDPFTLPAATMPATSPARRLHKLFRSTLLPLHYRRAAPRFLERQALTAQIALASTSLRRLFPAMLRVGPALPLKPSTATLPAPLPLVAKPQSRLPSAVPH